MKKISRFAALFVAFALCLGLLALPAAATEPAPDPDPTSAPTQVGAYLVNYKLTSTTGTELYALTKGQKFNLTLDMHDDTKPIGTIRAVINSSYFAVSSPAAATTPTGSAAKGYDYTLTFKNVICNTSSGDATLNVDLAYPGTNLQMAQISVPLSVQSADDPTPTPEPTETPSGGGVYVQAVTVTDPAGGEVATVEWNDRVNIVLRVVDHSSAQNNVEAGDIVTRINSSVFTYTGVGEISQLVEGEDDDGDYYSYVLLFRDVLYNGGGNTLPIDLSYLDTSMALQQFSVTVGQCVDKDPNDPADAKTPSLVVRQSSYGSEAVTAGNPFTLSLTVYATKGSEGLDDVIVSLTLPKGVTLSGGSLSTYVGSIAARGTYTVSYPVLPASSYTEGVADITVNMTGIGAASGNAASGSSIISIPISQPDRFELGDLQQPDPLTVGEQNSITLNFVNKGKNPVANLEATLTGNNLGADSQTQYVGNIAAGTSNSVDFDITPDQPGPYSGTITLNYEDGNGVIKNLSQNFSGTVEEAVYMDDFGPTPVEEPQKAALPLPLMIGGAAVFAVVVGILLALRRRRKAAALARLEDDDDGFDETPAPVTTPAARAKKDEDDHEIL